MSAPGLLSIQDLEVAFRIGERGGARPGPGRQGVSFDIPENSTVALVGESGSGKSVTAMSVLNLLPDNAQRRGRILWQGATCCRPAWPSCRRCAARKSPASSRTR
jgi:peptide/nickel transport system ATP-binding protein